MAPNPDSGTIAAPPSLEELLKKNPELSMTDLEYLQDWMSKQPHLPKLTHEQLVPFLHANYYSLERSKSTIENYFTIRTHAPAMFQNRDPLDPEVKKQLTVVNVGLLSKRDSRGYKIICSMWNNTDPNEFDLEVSLRAANMVIDQENRDDPTCPGYVVVMDNRGTQMGHVVKLCVSLTKIFLTYVQEAIPFRIKEINIIFCNPLVDMLMRFVKPFMQGELLNMIRLHSGEMEDFYKEFPKEILPTEFNGELGSLRELQATTIKKLIANRDWFLEQDKLLVDETKRAGKPKSAGDVFGMEGSFKKLDID